MFSAFMGDPLALLAYYASFLPAIILAFTLHEFGHALAAVAFGDETPRDQGRLTLNPMAHIDPVGLIFMIIMRFGWAKPVQIRPANFGHPRRDEILVSLAGVTMNFLTAFALYGVLSTIGGYAALSAAETVSERLAGWLVQVVSQLYQVSLLLCVFNLIPCPPLDGWQVLKAVVGPAALKFTWQVERYGFILLIVLSFVGALGLIIAVGTGVLSAGIASFYGLMGVR